MLGKLFACFIKARFHACNITRNFLQVFAACFVISGNTFGRFKRVHTDMLNQALNAIGARKHRVKRGGGSLFCIEQFYLFFVLFHNFDIHNKTCFLFELGLGVVAEFSAFSVLLLLDDKNGCLSLNSCKSD